MQKNKKILIIAAVVLLVIAAALFFIEGSKKPVPIEGVDENMLSKNTRANDYYLFLIQLISHPQLI